MTDRSAARFPRRVRRGILAVTRRRRRRLFPAGVGEFALPLDLQFELELSELPRQCLVFLDKNAVPLAFGVQLSMEHREVIMIFARGLDQRPHRGAPQVRAMADLRAGEFVARIKAELHGASIPRMPAP